ncbi:MAG: branched-chain amino acid ABC transporter permease [Lachnospiraceae bacterium]
MISTIFNYLINGLTMGAIYALLAIGVTVVYKSMGMMNVAHANTVMLSAFVTLTIYKWTNSLVLSCVSGVIGMGIFGYILERFIYRKVNYDSFTNLMLATIGMQIILINSARAIWGVDPYPFPQIFSIRPIKFGPVRVLPQSIGIIGVAAVVVIILQCFYKFTKTGQSMTAAATSPKAAMMLGINVAKTRNLTFTISAMLACISAILVSPMYNVYPEMGASVGTKGFCAAVIGGFGSIPAALVGGILLGIIESLVSGVLSAAYRDIIAFIIMILILYLKPAGLLGKKVEQKF